MFVKMPSGYHQKNKERLRKEPREMYQNLSEEEKNIKHHNACKKYQNLSEEEEEEEKKSICIIVNAMTIFLMKKNKS